MPIWSKKTPLRAMAGRDHVETWFSQGSPEDEGRAYQVSVRLGKPVDILTLKSNVIEGFGSYVSHMRSAGTLLFQSADLEEVLACPVCRSANVADLPSLTVYGGGYCQCADCDHYFLGKRPSEESVREFYAQDTFYADTYTDKRTAEMRVQQIAMSKAEWMADQFSALYGRNPETVLDVGAGSGHFVHACRRMGIEARGIEISDSSREFCRSQFGFDLEDVDFLEAWQDYSPVDIVTFWGVIEHVTEPMGLMHTARKAIREEESLVVAEVPRWDCLGTAVQSAYSDSIIRHLNPISHIHCFTDTSLATVFESSGLAPAAAWYFGMDAYELAVQLAYHAQEDNILRSIGQHIPSWQACLDGGRLSDEIVVAGRPIAAEGFA